MPMKILSCGNEKDRIIIHKSYCLVAFIAEKPAYFAGFVIVVNMQRSDPSLYPFSSGQLSTDSALLILKLEHEIILFQTYAILSQESQMSFSDYRFPVWLVAISTASVSIVEAILINTKVLQRFYLLTLATLFLARNKSPFSYSLDSLVKFIKVPGRTNFANASIPIVTLIKREMLLFLFLTTFGADSWEHHPVSRVTIRIRTYLDREFHRNPPMVTFFAMQLREAIQFSDFNKFEHFLFSLLLDTGQTITNIAFIRLFSCVWSYRLFSLYKLVYEFHLTTFPAGICHGYEPFFGFHQMGEWHFELGQTRTVDFLGAQE